MGNILIKCRTERDVGDRRGYFDGAIGQLVAQLCQHGKARQPALHVSARRVLHRGKVEQALQQPLSRGLLTIECCIVILAH